LPWFSSGSSPQARLPKRTSDAALESIGVEGVQSFRRCTEHPRRGGSEVGVGVELWVKRKDGADLSQCGHPASVKPAEDYLNGFVLARVVRPSGRGPAGKRWGLGGCANRFEQLLAERARRVLRIVDASDKAHLNVGTIELRAGGAGSGERRAAANRCLCGVRRFHAHPTNNLSTRWSARSPYTVGAPGGGIEDYLGNDAKAVERFSLDIPPCDDPHMASTRTMEGTRHRR